ncbi:hypothetical protein [Roseomonas xinghualingensis]|uniref:hypothetical protein n=1 Tax=Roseomonas xinghualingensis TaxID=2986475 RepID=UPI0021F166EF|nr:hypothetical protein [Roseomonas sp. SXEYE001]MCV4210290.1 hypothetical protein [Roseomonas sp. SXEYE001]
MRVDLTRAQDAHSFFRQLVEAGLPDQPVELHYDGKHCLSFRSLHRAALLTTGEEPRCRHVRWTPHPNATVGPRVAALLAARAERDARRKVAA